MKSFFRNKNCVSWRSVAKDGIHIFVVDTVFRGRCTLGSTSMTQWALVDLIVVEIS